VNEAWPTENASNQSPMLLPTYSRTGHAAISQCAVYLRHFQDYIDAVRENIRSLPWT
jgi:hypothetical protein